MVVVLVVAEMSCFVVGLFYDLVDPYSYLYL